MRCFLLAVLGALASACGLTPHVRPVPRGTLAVEAAVGGPIANLGVPLPLPLATVGASYGVAESVDVHAHPHLTPLLLGTAGFDAGATWLAVTEEGWRPALSLTGRAYTFSDFSTGALFYGEAGAAASWRLGGRPGGRGAFGLVLGASYRFGDGGERAAASQARVDAR